MEDHQDRSGEYEDDGLLSEPFDPEKGIQFRHGRAFQDKEVELGGFESHCGFSLPEDFKAMIGDSCEGGFDLWYEVKSGDFGSIGWNKLLLLMRVPLSVDRELDAELGVIGGHSHATDLLEKYSASFYREGSLVRLPFGHASALLRKGPTKDGLLVFDASFAFGVFFLPRGVPKMIKIADSFSEMMKGANLQTYG